MISHSTKISVVLLISTLATQAAGAEIKGFLRFFDGGCRLVRHEGSDREAKVLLNPEFCGAYKPLKDGFLTVTLTKIPCPAKPADKREFCAFGQSGKLTVYDPMRESLKKTGSR